jgi:hypothetical protein
VRLTEFWRDINKEGIFLMNALGGAVAAHVPTDILPKMMGDFPELHPTTDAERQVAHQIQSNRMLFLDSLTAPGATYPLDYCGHTLQQVFVIGKTCLEEYMYPGGPKTMRYRAFKVTAQGYSSYLGLTVPIEHAEVCASFAILIHGDTLGR